MNCRIHRLRWLLSTIALAAAACTNQDPTDVGRYLITFVASPTAVVAADTATAQPDFRRIVFNGKLSAPNACVDVSPTVTADGKDITFTVDAKAQSGTCALQAVAYFTYNALTGNFNPATYHVKVVHKTSAATRTVFQGDVVVPQ